MLNTCEPKVNPSTSLMLTPNNKFHLGGSVVSEISYVDCWMDWLIW